MRAILYRAIMRFIHRFGIHYAPLKQIQNDLVRWCEWCGFRESYKKTLCPLSKEWGWHGCCKAGEVVKK